LKRNRLFNWESITLYLDFVGFICISLYIWFGLKPIQYTETYHGIIGDFTPIIKAINNLLEASGFLYWMRFGFILITFSFVIKIYRRILNNRGVCMNNEYRISISKERFEVLKNNQKFLKILILARFVNALRFCQMSSFLKISDTEGTYARKRQTINAPLFTSSVLYEGFRFAEEALKKDKDFNQMDVYKEGIGAIINDDKNKKLIKNSLRIMRNRFVFHFDQIHLKDTEESLHKYNSDSYIFALAHGEAGRNMYYALADEFFINFLLDKEGTKSKEELSKSLKDLYQDTLKLMARFTEETEKLIAEVLLQFGLTVDVDVSR